MLPEAGPRSRPRPGPGRDARRLDGPLAPGAAGDPGPVRGVLPLPPGRGRPGQLRRRVPAAVDRADLPVSFLVAIREDALARLDRFKGRIPNLFENYVRIRHLNASSAEAAILQPLRGSTSCHRARSRGRGRSWSAGCWRVQVGRVVLAVVGRGGVTEAAGQPPDPPIETPYLQMVLTRLWAREAEEGSRRLRLRTLEALGGPSIVRTHLDEALDGLGPSSRRRPRPSSYLVTPSGSKIGHTAADLANYTGLPTERVRAVLAALAAPEARIVRPVPAPSGWTRSLATRSSTTCSPRRSWAGGPSGRPGGRPRRPPAASSRSGPALAAPPGAGGGARRRAPGGGGRAGRAGGAGRQGRAGGLGGAGGGPAPGREHGQRGGVVDRGRLPGPGGHHLHQGLGRRQGDLRGTPPARRPAAVRQLAGGHGRDRQRTLGQWRRLPSPRP